MDWDQFTFWNAVSRETLLKYNQFPLWNPYSNGGNVLLAFPHSSFFSPLYFLILLFGAVVGLKLQWLFSLFLGMVGMFFLAKNFKIYGIGQYCAPIVFMLSSYFTLHLAEGHADFISLAFLPWLFLFLRKIPCGRRYFFLMVFSLVMIVLAGATDILAIAVFLIITYSLFFSIKEKNSLYFFTALAALLLVFMVCAIKLVPTVEFLKYSSHKIESIDRTAPSFLPLMLLSRDQNSLYQNTKWTSPRNTIKFQGREFAYGWHEYGAYTGFLPLILALIGILFAYKTEWPLLITGIICLLICLGEYGYLNLWGALHRLPVYNSLHVPSRYIIGFIFSISLFAGLGLEGLSNFCKLSYSKLIMCVVTFLICLDLLSVDYPILKSTFSIKQPNIERFGEFRQRYRDLNLYPGKSRSCMYISFSSNSGIINSYEIIHVKKGAVKIAGENGYRGEAYLLEDNGSIIKIGFSPNRIDVVAQVLKPDRLVLNQNFYTGWKIKGVKGKVQPFDGLISIKLPEGINKVTFYYLPDSFLFGAALTILTICLLTLIKL
jgi:hypothetical protein